MFVFGSVIRGDYNIMLSDIDIVVITDRKDRIYEFKAEVDRWIEIK